MSNQMRNVNHRPSGEAIGTLSFQPFPIKYTNNNGIKNKFHQGEGHYHTTPLVITDFSGGAPPEKNKPVFNINKRRITYSNDVRTKSKRTKTKQLIPAPVRLVGKTQDINLLSSSIVKLAKEVLGESVDTLAVTTLIQEAQQKYGNQDTIASAMKWADNFKFANNIGERDREKVESKNGDVVAYIQDLHASALANRLNLDRIRKHIPASDPDYHSLCRLVEGVPILTKTSFTPNQGYVRGIPIRMRAKYLAMSPVVNKLVQDLYLGGHVLILPTDICRGRLGTHYSVLSWKSTREVDRRYISNRKRGTVELRGNETLV